MVLHDKVWIGREVRENSTILGGCPFNGSLSGTKYPPRAASPIKYNADQEPVKLTRLEP